MKETIDLYAKLVIGTFSFIGPSFTLFIPMFYQAFEKSSENHKNKLKVLISLSSQNRDIKKLIRKNEREINFLKPRRQVRRLFIGLFASLILISFYYFQHSTFWPYKSQILRGVTVFTSGIFFVHCLRVLWQVFCTIITLKSEEEKDKARRKVKSKTTLLTQT